MSGGISGIKIASEVEEAFAALNKREFAVVILKISKDMQTVEVEKTIKASSGDPQAEWKDVVKLMPESDCRFVISDFSYKDTPTVTKSKIVMIAWSPECAPIKSKMIYASSKETVANRAQGLQKSLQATESAEIDYMKVKDQVFK